MRTLVIVLSFILASCGPVPDDNAAAEMLEAEDIRLDRLWVEKNVRSCPSAVQLSDDLVATRREVRIRTGPGARYPAIKNTRASDVLNKAMYYELDDSTSMHVECETNGWSRIRFVHPEWWSHVAGWVRTSDIVNRTS